MVDSGTEEKSPESLNFEVSSGGCEKDNISRVGGWRDYFQTSGEQRANHGDRPIVL